MIYGLLKKGIKQIPVCCESNRFWAFLLKGFKVFLEGIYCNIYGELRGKFERKLKENEKKIISF